MSAFRLVAALLAGLMAPAAAQAHAHLERSEPAAGATVVAPQEIVLRFSEPVEAAVSRVTVTDASGRRIDAGQAVADPANRAILHVPLAGTPNGRCRVQWRVMSVDSHVMKGDFSFDVRP